MYIYFFWYSYSINCLQLTQQYLNNPTVYYNASLHRIYHIHRYKIRGVKHLIFYQLPQHPHFYSEMCNSMRDRRKQKMTATDTFSCTVLYSRYDAQRLVGVLGNKRAGEIMIADKPVHMLVTGES